MWTGFKKVNFTCTACGARQRIPLRRIHFFEKFHQLESGQPVLILCPHCYEGLQIPTSYRTHDGYRVDVDPEDPPKDAFIHGVLPGAR